MDLHSTGWLLGGTLVPSFLISFFATFALRHWAPRWGLIDRPAARKVHTAPTPLGGGLAIGLGVIVPFLVGQVVLWAALSNSELLGALPAIARTHFAGLVKQSPDLWILLGGGAVLLIVGLIDDFRGLGWQLRLAIQFAVAAACVLWQGWRLTAFIDVPALTWFLSVAWIVALINSFNMLDNMDGLSPGVALIAAGMLSAILLMNPDPATQRPQLFVAGLLLVVAGSLAGFLWHNRPPARIFMGDAGSYFVGFCIAVATLLATYAGYKSTTQHAVLSPLCLMAVPLYDMTTVIWIRLRSGRSPFEADKNHFSHRLVQLGLTKGQAVATIYLTTVTCGLGALLLPRVDVVGAVIILVLIACVLALIAILESTGRRNQKS